MAALPRGLGSPNGGGRISAPERGRGHLGSHVGRQQSQDRIWVGLNTHPGVQPRPAASV